MLYIIFYLFLFILFIILIYTTNNFNNIKNINKFIFNKNDNRYNALLTGFNRRWILNPSNIILCQINNDIINALKLSINSNKRITVGSGFHCYENFIVNNNGIILDLSMMDKIIKKDNYTIIEPGALNLKIQAVLIKKWNTILPGGSCYSVAAGGHICGGGYGLLSRKFGLTVDWLEGIEVIIVDKNKKIKTVQAFKDSEKQNLRDLWWGHTGGGGGNFGIITKYFFKELPSAPKNVYVCNINISWDYLTYQKFYDILYNFGKFCELDEKENKYLSLFSLLKLYHISAKEIKCVIQSEFINDIIYFLNIVFNIKINITLDNLNNLDNYQNIIDNTSINIIKFPLLTAIVNLNGSGDSQRFKMKSSYMKKTFPESQIKTLYNWLSGKNVPTYNNSNSLVQIDTYGGMINKKSSIDTAVSARDSIMKLQYQVYWTSKEDDDKNLKWIRELYIDMYGINGPVPDDIMDGCYVNYPDNDLINYEHLYYKDNYSKLQKIKKIWDPNNFFNHQQSIRI